MPRRTVRLLAAAAATAAIAACSGDPLPVEYADVAPDASPSQSADPTPLPSPPPSRAAFAVAPVRPDGLPVVPRPGEPVAAQDAAGLARQLASAAAVVADPARTDRELAHHGHVMQVAVRALVLRPGQRGATYALLPAPLRDAVQADVTAGDQLRSLVGKPRTSLPRWRIVRPAPAEELLHLYRLAEAEFGVPWHVLAAIHLVESRMGRIRGTSSAGAQGPMQFMPSTWAAYGEGDINSNRDAIRAAARYLKRNGAPGNLRNAVWNYNHDDRYVGAVLAYANRMRAHSRSYYGYYHWQVYYVTVAGDVWLPVGYLGS